MEFNFLRDIIYNLELQKISKKSEVLSKRHFEIDFKSQTYLKCRIMIAFILHGIIVLYFNNCFQF